VSCPLLRSGIFSKLCLATLSEPQQQDFCKRNFWECEIYKSSPCSPKVISFKKGALADYENMKNKYLEYLRKLEELLINGELEPQVFSTLLEKYEKDLEACLRMLRYSELHD
jgi:hypothetical protein